MNSFSQTWKQLHGWQKFLIYTGILLLSYALMGFFALPALGRYVLENKVAQALQRPVQVAEIKFQPFTLRAQIHGFSVQDKNRDIELAGFDHLQAQIDLASLWRLALVINDLHLDGPRIHLWLDDQGQTNVADLTSTSPPKEKQKDPYVLPIVVEPLTITNGTFSFEDQGRAMEHVVDQINFNLPHFSSRKKDWETFMEPTLSFCVNQAPFHLQGQTMPFSNSLRTEFDLQATNFDLPPYGLYFLPQQKLTLSQGSLKLDSQLVFEQHDQSLPTFSIQGIIQGQDLHLSAQEDLVFALPKLQIIIEDISILNQALHLNKVELEQPWVKIIGDHDGALNWAKYFVSEPGPVALEVDNSTLASSGLKNATTQEDQGQTTPLPDQAQQPKDNDPQGLILPWNVAIDEIKIDQAQLVWEDQKTDFTKIIENLNLNIFGLDTASQDPSTLTLQLRTAEAEELALNASLSLQHLLVEGQVQVQGVDLPGYTPYFQEALPLTLTQGKIDLQGHWFWDQGPQSFGVQKGQISIQDFVLEAADQGGKITLGQALWDDLELQWSDQVITTGPLTIKDLNIHTAVHENGQAQLLATLIQPTPQKPQDPGPLPAWEIEVLGLDLQDLKLSLAGQSPSPVHIAAVKTKTIALDTGQQSLHLGPIDINLAAQITRQASGAVDVLSLWPSGDNKSSPAPKTRDQAMWDLNLEELTLTQSTLNIVDQSTNPPVQLPLENINIRAQNITAKAEQSIPIQLSCALPNSGLIEAQGNLIPQSMTGQGTLKLDKLPLSLGSNYLSQWAPIELPGGRLGANLTWTLGPDLKHQVAGQVQIDGLQLIENKTKKEILAFKSLDINDLLVHLSPLAINIGQINILEPRSTIVIDEQGQGNWQQLASKPETPSPAQDSAASPGLEKVNIDSLTLKHGRLTFLDQSIAPVFQTTISPIDLSLASLSLSPEQQAHLDLAAIIDDSGSINIQGSIAPAQKPIKVNTNATLRNLDLTALSPYAAKFMAYPITQGHLDWDMQVQTADNILNMGNKIKAQQFNLGSKVESDQAIDAPIKLGLALLRDMSGNIAINLPVKGDLSDPKLSVGGIVVQALVTLIIKAVASPFSLLSALIPEGSPPLDHLQFVAGQSTITAKSEQALHTLADILEQRPGMNLVLQGQINPQADLQGLADLEFYRKLQMVKFESLSRKEREKTNVQDLDIDDEEYRDILWQAYKNEPVEKEKNALGMHKEVSTEVQENKLRELIQIPDLALERLAEQRAALVHNFLLDLGIAEQRMVLKAVDPQGWSGQAEVLIQIQGQDSQPKTNAQP